MKKKTIAEYARQIKKLFTKLRKAGGKVSLPPVDDPMDQLLRGALSTYASETRADAALAKLRGAMVDLNELRVTPVSEIIEVIGVDYPSCRSAAEEISRALNAVYNRVHGQDLGFLKGSSRKAAESFLASLDGVGDHAKASVMLRCFKSHVIPVDANMHVFLKKNGYVPEGATVEDAQKLLTRQIKERDGVTFYVLAKRYASVHAPRKIAKKAASKREPTPVVDHKAARKPEAKAAAKTAVKAGGAAKAKAPGAKPRVKAEDEAAKLRAKAKARRKDKAAKPAMTAKQVKKAKAASAKASRRKTSIPGVTVPKKKPVTKKPAGGSRSRRSAGRRSG